MLTDNEVYAKFGRIPVETLQSLIFCSRAKCEGPEGDIMRQSGTEPVSHAKGIHTGAVKAFMSVGFTLEESEEYIRSKLPDDSVV